MQKVRGAREKSPSWVDHLQSCPMSKVHLGRDQESDQAGEMPGKDEREINLLEQGLFFPSVAIKKVFFN